MRPIAAILLFYWCLGSFFPRGDFSQLAALPSLVQHYQMHKNESDRPLSFLAFFSQHYSGAIHHHHDDSSSHKNLPLKNLLEFQWIGAKFMPTIPIPPTVLVVRMPDHSPSPLSEGIRDSVFRPPLAA